MPVDAPLGSCRLPCQKGSCIFRELVMTQDTLVTPALTRLPHAQGHGGPTERYAW